METMLAMRWRVLKTVLRMLCRPPARNLDEIEALKLKAANAAMWAPDKHAQAVSSTEVFLWCDIERTYRGRC